MDFITNDHDMVRAVQSWAFTGTAKLDLTADEKDRIISTATTGGPGDVICNTAEFLYAHFDKLDEAGTTLMAQCFALAARNGWSGFNQDDRCSKVVGYVMKERGEKSIIPLGKGPPPEPQTELRSDNVDWRVEKGLVKAPEPVDAIAAAPAAPLPQPDAPTKAPAAA